VLLSAQIEGLCSVKQNQHNKLLDKIVGFNGAMAASFAIIAAVGARV
jgi:hypothetical protein